MWMQKMEKTEQDTPDTIDSEGESSLSSSLRFFDRLCQWLCPPPLACPGTWLPLCLAGQQSELGFPSISSLQPGLESTCLQLAPGGHLSADSTSFPSLTHNPLDGNQTHRVHCLSLCTLEFHTKKKKNRCWEWTLDPSHLAVVGEETRGNGGSESGVKGTGEWAGETLVEESKKFSGPCPVQLATERPAGWPLAGPPVSPNADKSFSSLAPKYKSLELLQGLILRGLGCG